MPEDLIKKLNKLLESPYLSKEEKEEWRKLAPQMTDKNLQKLIDTLEKEQVVLKKASHLFQDTLGEYLAPSLRVPQMSVEEAARLTMDQLRDSKIFNQLRELVLEVVFERNIGDSQEILNNLENQLKQAPGFSKESPDLFKQYQDLILRLKFCCLPNLDDKEIQKLIRENLLKAFDYKIDVKDKLILLFILYKDRKRGRDLLRKLLEALLSNPERLGDQDLERKGVGESVPPTIRNWLVDYEQFFEKERPRKSLEEIMYLNKGVNVRKLDDRQKTILFKIIQIYDFLKFPELQGEEVIATYAEPSKIPGVEVKKPVLEAKEEAKPAGIEGLIRTYSADLAEQAQIAEEENKILEITGSQLDKIKEEFYRALSAKNKNRTIASIRILAKYGELVKSLREEKRFQNLVKPYLKEKYGEEIVADFEKNLGASAYFSAFLQYILKEKFNLSESDSARLGIQLENIVPQATKSEYQNIVYGDLKTGEYKWTPLVKEEDRLVISLRSS